MNRVPLASDYRVSIPLRKFRKDENVAAIREQRAVSIPLRKFRKAIPSHMSPDCVVGFHPSKEV